jgi:methyltransferase-like protein/trans-aconitate methyltransferase
MSSSPSEPVSRYDRVLYPSYTRVQSHPDRSATLATLLGMTPAPVETCRVLEIGCGNGSNLCPIAFSLPGSQCVGLDLASTPIAHAQEMARDLGLRNVTFSCCDIMKVPADLGTLDYIIAHGIYSWIPAEVRDKLLALCREHLAPQGVAFVSYNAYPGNYVNQMVRTMLLYHVRGFDDPQQQVAQGIALAKLIAESQESPDAYRQLVKEELDRFLKVSPSYIFHDALADINEPSYFHQFAAHAARHQLQYLGEADFHEMLDVQFKPAVTKALDQVAADRIEREQYLDFLKCRRFRQTLLCHGAVRLDLSLKPQLAAQFCVASPAKSAEAKPEIFSTATETFQGNKGGSIQTNSPVSKAAFMLLAGIWPQPLPFAELLSQVQELLRKEKGSAGEEDALELGKTLLKSYAAGLVELHSYLPSYARTLSERPTASALARWQATHGSFATTLYHNTLFLEDPLAKQMLPLLDGTRDRAALVDALAVVAGTQGWGKSTHLGPNPDPRQLKIFLAAELESNLLKLLRAGLLVA